MRGELIRILTAAVFLAGVLSSVLCLTAGHRAVSGCCHSKAQSASSNTENCLSHCAKQKLFAVNAEGRLFVEPRIQSPHLVKNHIMPYLQTAPFSLNHAVHYYINQPIVEFNAGQVYFTPLFNHAPPSAF